MATLLIKDKIFLIISPIVGMIISIFFDTPYLISIFLFYGIPGVYLASKYSKNWQIKKSLFFVAIMAIPFAIIIDYIGIRSGVWYTPSTLFFSRFLGVIPYEDFIWMVTGTWVIIMIYETLLDRGKHELMDKKIVYFVLIAILLLSGFFFLLILGDINIFTFKSKYTYLFLGTLFFLIPTLLFLFKFKKFFKKILPLAIYFFYLTLLFEITATFLKQWIFTGAYIFQPFNFFGYALVPFEELFFVGIVGPFAAVAFYEFFDDDNN